MVPEMRAAEPRSLLDRQAPGEGHLGNLQACILGEVNCGFKRQISPFAIPDRLVCRSVTGVSPMVVQKQAARWAFGVAHCATLLCRSAIDTASQGRRCGPS